MNMVLKVFVSMPFARKFHHAKSNCSGPIDTPIFRNAEKVGVTSRDTFASDTLLARIGEAEEVAECIAFLLSSKSGYVTGVELPIDGGMAA
jgi:NAD(P)-dependent dehydrogenase (short-subunit alcohol dehydrogenase family)